MELFFSCEKSQAPEVWPKFTTTHFEGILAKSITRWQESVEVIRRPLGHQSKFIAWFITRCINNEKTS